MRTKTTLAVLLMLGLFTQPALASSPASIPVGNDDNSPTSITADFKCRIVEVRPDESTLVLLELESDTLQQIELDDSIKLRARSKKDFNGRKKLGLADLRRGQEVKVTVYLADGSIRRITVLTKA